MRREAAFTLVELLVVIAVAAILTSQAVPSFRSLIQNNRVATAANTLISALMATRSEAIKRGRRVTLCKSADGATCTADGHYEQGFILFVDVNGDALVSDPDQVLRVFGPLSGVTARGNEPVVRYVSYLPTGATARISGAIQAGSVFICSGNAARRVAISRTGRPRIEPAALADC